MGFHGTFGTKIGARDIIRDSKLGVHCNMKPVSYPGTGLIWRDIQGTDSTGTPNNGTLVDTIYDYRNKGSLVFNGSTSYGRYTTLNAAPVYPFTICAWAMAHATGNYWIAGFCRSSTNVPQQSIWFSSSGKMSAVSENTTPAGQKQADSKITYKPYQWYNVVGVFASATSRNIYVNGDYQATETTSVLVTPSIDRFSIGRFDRLTPAIHLNGKISNILYYTKQLTDTEIKHNYLALRDKYKSVSS